MKVSANGNKIQIFCFKCDCFYEVSEGIMLHNARIVGTDTIYDTILLHIKINNDVIVEFYLTESDLKQQSLEKTKTLSECYSIYQNPNNENK